jgi:hypothetical protein
VTAADREAEIDRLIVDAYTRQPPADLARRDGLLKTLPRLGRRYRVHA